MYAAENISFAIKQKKLLNNVSISIEPSGFTTILGANGAGKSTLIKVLSGEIKKYEGTIKVGNKDIRAIDELELAQTRAVLSQNTQIQFPYTVLEVVMLGGFSFNVSEEQTREIPLEKLRSIGMLHMQSRQFLSLSGGEQQKVHLARVLTQISNSSVKQKFLFLDEPTSALDMAHQHLLLGKVRSVCKNEKVGVLAILHDLNLAVQYADNILFLKHGKVVANGALDVVFSKEIIQETYGYPVDIQMNTRNGLPLVIPFANANNSIKSDNEQIKTINYDTIYS